MSTKTWGGALIPLGEPVKSLFAGTTGKEPEPLWPTQQVSLIAGSSGAGKTTILFQLFHAWSQGQLFGGFAGPPGPYGMLAADRTIQAHKKLATHIGLSFSHFRSRSLVDDKDLDLKKLEDAPFPLLLSLLTAIRNELPADQPGLIVVDPLMIFLGVDLNKYHLVASKLIQLNRWCIDFNTTIIGTHHASKPRTDWSFKRPQDRIAGSGALLAFTSTQGFMAGPDEIGDDQATWNEWTTVSHHHSPLTVRLIRNDQGLFEPMGLANGDYSACIAQPTPPVHPALVDLSNSASQMFLGMPDGEEVNRKVLVLLCATERSADRALAELLDKGLVHKVSHGLYKKASIQ